jgi:uncharacterized protein with beta-barrel porin domain
MNSRENGYVQSSALGITLCIILAAVFNMWCIKAEAQQLGYHVSTDHWGRQTFRIDGDQVVDIGAGATRTHGNGDPKSEYNGSITYDYGTINVLQGGQLKTDYTYYDNDKQNPKTGYLVEANPLIVTNSGSLIVRKGGQVFNQGAIENYGYTANYGTWHNWFMTQMGLNKNSDRDNLTPRFDNYGMFNNMYKYGVIAIYRGTFNNYGIIESSGAFHVDSRNTVWDDVVGNKQPDPTYLINHPGAVINMYKSQRSTGMYIGGATVINNGTITFHPGTESFNRFGGLLINNSTVHNFGTITNTGFQAFDWYHGVPVPAYVRSSYFENNGTRYNHPGSAVKTLFTANMVNNGTFINQGRIEFTSGQYSGYDGYDAKPQVNGNKPGYFKNYGVLRNDGEIILKSSIHGSEFIIHPDGWEDDYHTKETGPGTMTNQGLITGKGSLEGIVINELNGTIAPGDSIGTMTIIGNYTNNPGSYLETELDNKSADKLIVTGTATLNGGKVTPVYSGLFVRNVPYTYTILTAAGGVAGKFTGLVNNSAFFDTYLSYFPFSVDLALTRRGFDSVCETENQCAVANGLEGAYPVATGDMRDVLNALLNLSAYQARSAYDQMGGLIHTTVPAVTFSSFNQYRDMMTARMSGFLPGGASSMLGARFPMLASRTDSGTDVQANLPAGSAAPITGTAAPITGTRPLPWGVWLETYGDLGERRANDISSRYDYNTTGIILGFDRKIGSSLLLGGTLGYSYTKVTMKDLAEDAKIASYMGSLYGVWTNGPWYVNGVAGYAYNKYDTNREMSFGTISRSADASYYGHLLAGYVEGGYRVKMTYADIIPRASFQATRSWRASFSEDGAGTLSLDADSEAVSSYLGSLGVTVRKDYVTKAGILSPELRFRWDHEFSNDNHVLNASFSGYPMSQFTVMADRPDRDRLGAGLGLTLKTRSNIYLSVYYDGYFSNDTTQHSGMVGIQYKW